MVDDLSWWSLLNDELWWWRMVADCWAGLNDHLLGRKMDDLSARRSGMRVIVDLADTRVRRWIAHVFFF